VWQGFKEGNAACFVSRSWRVAWPMTLIMCFDFLVGLTDVFVAGRVGKDVQAAYGFVIQLYMISIIIANALTVGTVSVVSRLFAAGEQNELKKTVFTSLAASAGAGAFFAILGIILSPVLIEHLNIPAQIKPYCVPLIRIYSAGLLFQYIVVGSNGVLRSCNRIKDSLKTMTVVCCLNVGLNLFFVFYTPLSYRGIALATITAVAVGSLMNLRLIGRITQGIRAFSGDVVRQIARIGWPMGALQVLWQLGAMALFLVLAELPENKVEIIAAFTAGLRIESLIYLPAFAFNMANAVIVGNLLGAKKQEEAYKSGLITALVGVSVVVVLVLIVIANARWIAPLLSTNPIVVRECTRYIYIALISEPFMAWGVILGGGLSGAGDTRSVMMRIAFSVWFVRIPLAYLLVVVFGFGAASVWWSMNISQFVQAFLLYRRYSKKDWLVAQTTQAP
jgi:multidrug resistance protein, MATE family